MYALELICVFAETILEIVVVLGIIIVPFMVLGLAWEIGKFYITEKRNGKRCRQEQNMFIWQLSKAEQYQYYKAIKSALINFGCFSYDRLKECMNEKIKDLQGLLQYK